MSDIQLYDKAVYDYLYQIIPRVVYAPTDKASYTITKNPEYKDKVPFPFISFYRNPSLDIENERQTDERVKGTFLRLREDNVTKEREARYVCSIPVSLTYQVDIWATKATVLLDYAEQLIMDLLSARPVLIVPINFEGEDGRFHILDVSWSDNSDLEEEKEHGRLYRHTITFTIDARIKRLIEKKTTKVTCPDIDIYE